MQNVCCGLFFRGKIDIEKNYGSFIQQDSPETGKRATITVLTVMIMMSNTVEFSPCAWDCAVLYGIALNTYRSCNNV